MSKDKIEFLIDYISANQFKIDFNNKLFEIMEGDLLKYVQNELNNQLNQN